MKTLTLFVSLCAAATLGSCASRAEHRASLSALAHSESRTNAASAEALLYYAGISPESLAVIGASETQVRTLCGAARMICAGQSPGFDEVLETYEHHAGEIQRLADRVLTGQASREDRLRLEAAHAAMGAQATVLEGFVEQIESTVHGTFNESQRAWLRNIDSATGVDVPAAYKVVTRSEVDWCILRDQISSAGRRNAPPDGISDVATAQALQALFADPVLSEWSASMGR